MLFSAGEYWQSDEQWLPAGLTLQAALVTFFTPVPVPDAPLLVSVWSRSSPG